MRVIQRICDPFVHYSSVISSSQKYGDGPIQPLLCYSFESFSHQCYMMIFHWKLNDSKSPQVSRTLLSILTDLNNTVVWMIASPIFLSIRLQLLSPSSSGSTVFFIPLARSKYLSFFSHSFSKSGKVHYLAGSLFLLTITRSSRLAEIR